MIKLQLLILLLALLSCSERPKEKQFTNQLNFSCTPNEKDNGLWFTTSSTDEGSLFRYDLTALSSLSSEVERITSDTVLARLKNSKVALINRNEQASLVLYKDSKEILNEVSLNEGKNPHDIFEDKKGNLWIAFWGSNEIVIYNQEKRESVKAIKVDGLTIPGRKYSGFHKFIELGNGELGVLAQRYDINEYKPMPRSGFAVLDIENQKLKSTSFIKTVNPIYMRKEDNGLIRVVGAGSYIKDDGLDSSIDYYRYDKGQLVFVGGQKKNSNILGYAVSRDGVEVKSELEFNPNITCVSIDGEKIFCDDRADQNYRYGEVAISGNCVFGSDTDFGKSVKLWSYNIDSRGSSEVEVRGGLINNMIFAH
jgi:hypothetical protein